jgi:hypothetical protein
VLGAAAAVGTSGCFLSDTSLLLFAEEEEEEEEMERGAGLTDRNPPTSA